MNVEPKTILVIAFLVLALWLTRTRKPKLPTLQEAVKRVRTEGIFYYSDRPDTYSQLDFPPEARLVTAQFVNKGMSVMYWRTLKQGSTLETLDLLLTDRPVMQERKVTIHFVDGKPTGRRLGLNHTVLPLNQTDTLLAEQLLQHIRFGLPSTGGDNQDDWCQEFPLV